MDDGLFPEPEHVTLPEQPTGELAGLSPDRRRTVKARMAIEAGFHPLTGRPLLARGQGSVAVPVMTCGDCAKLHRVQHNDRHYLKCDERGDSSSAASDARRWWPACDLFRARP